MGQPGQPQHHRLGIRARHGQRQQRHLRQLAVHIRQRRVHHHAHGDDSHQRHGYTFKIRARNAKDAGAGSDSRSATPLDVPGAPTDFTATGDDAEIDLVWKAPAGSTVTGWEYRIRSAGNSDWDLWRAITPGSEANNTLTHSVTHRYYADPAIALGNNQAYDLQVRATNSSGGGTPSATRQAVPVASAPSKPTDLQSWGGNEQVRLSWGVSGSIWIDTWQYTTNNGTTWTDIPANSGGYTECLDTDGDPNTPAVCTDHATPAVGGNRHTRYAVITGLTNGKTYTFKIRGENDKGGGTGFRLHVRGHRRARVRHLHCRRRKRADHAELDEGQRRYDRHHRLAIPLQDDGRLRRMDERVRRRIRQDAHADEPG